MAYLNVRERRIETTIAYVGAEPSGASSNFERLRTSREGRASAVEEKVAGTGAVLSFDWWPNQLAKFDDCDVMVKLVTTRGSVSDDAVDGVIAAADGIVLVLDGDAEADGENQASVAAVRQVLARTTKSRPVVVQINEASSGKGAAPVEVFNASGADAAWPLVAASTARGTGIHETLERALSDVIETMKTDAGSEARSSVVPRATSPRTEGNPLLSALKQILQTTVAEHVEALEQRVTARMEGQLKAVRDDVARVANELEAKMDRAPSADLAKVPSQLEGLRQRLDGIESSLQDRIQSVEQTFADMPTDVLALREHAVDMRRELAGMEERSLTAAEARSRADREHATAAASVLRRAVEAVASDLRESKSDLKELRKSEARDSTKDIASRLDSVTSTAEGLRGFVEPAAQSVRAIPARIDELEARVQKQIRDELSRRFKAVDEAFSLLHSETSGALARVDARSAAIEANLTEFITELKQRKKGWFG